MIFNRENNIVKCNQVEEEEIQIEQAGPGSPGRTEKAYAEQWDNVEVPEDIYETILSNFLFTYPHMEEISYVQKPV